MTPEQWEKISDIFHAAAAIDPDKRAAYLDEVCNGDPLLRDEVESLLSAHEEASEFIEAPAIKGVSIDISEMPSLTGAYFSHYRIDKSIGRGGMGEVYLATDMRLNRKVALKKLPDRYAADPLFLKRFRNEAQAAATLNHPNVATIYSVEEFDGKPFITMEYVEGQTLENLLEPGGLPVKKLLEWFGQIADALLHAHEKGIIHRDIKPGNIMITPSGTPKMLDFGLAQFTGDAFGDGGHTNITQPGQIIGTPSYMAPEQARGKEVDHRADIFSLGVVMYEAATGRRPFVGDSNAELISNLLKTDPPLGSEVRRDLPVSLARLIDRCLKKSRRDRVQSMTEVRTVLEEVSALVSAGVSTGSLGRRLYREAIWPHTRRWIAAAAAVVILGLLGWYYFSASRGRLPISFERMTMRKVSQSNDVAIASISPDGKSLVYVAVEENGDLSLKLRRLDDNGTLLLVPPQPVQYWGRPLISEDGGQVFFMTAGRASPIGSIFRVSTLGGQPRKIVESANYLGALTDDGQRLIFVRAGSPVTLLSVNASDGSDERLIATAPNNETGYAEPRVSVDGSVIYMIKRDIVDGAESWSLVSMPAAGGPDTEILRQRERIWNLAVLRKSAGLIMTATEPTTKLTQLFHVSLPDGTKTRITNDLANYGAVSLDGADRNIISIQRTDEGRVFAGEATDLANLRVVTKDPVASGFVDWTPDGRLVYDARENNRSYIWISDPNGQSAERLTDSGADDYEARVSGDGRFIVFTSERAGFSQVWRMDVDGSNETLLANVEGWTLRPRFEADGRTVVFVWDRDGKKSFARVPVTGGNVEVMRDLPLDYSVYWAMSHDGQFVAFSYRDGKEPRTKLGIARAGESQPFAVLDAWPTEFLKWTPDDKYLFYLERRPMGGPAGRVFQIGPGSPQPKVLYNAEPGRLSDLTYSPDGKRVAVVKGRIISDAVLLSAAPGG
jgi:Tol biopolymer transport system component